MNTVTEIMEVENQTFQNSIFNLYNLLALKMPEYFGKQNLEISLHEDYAEVVLAMKRQLMAEDLAEMLETQIGASILYAVEESQGMVIRIEAYSLPVEDNMYIIYASSEQHGIMEAVTVCFYDSLDTMYHRLRTDYHYITQSKADFIEKQPLQVLIGNFI